MEVATVVSHTGSLEVKRRSNTTKLAGVRVARLGYGTNLFCERKVFINDKGEVAS